jgi:hypothetical protein
MLHLIQIGALVGREKIASQPVVVAVGNLETTRYVIKGPSQTYSSVREKLCFLDRNHKGSEDGEKMLGMYQNIATLSYNPQELTTSSSLDFEPMLRFG